MGVQGLHSYVENKPGFAQIVNLTEIAKNDPDFTLIVDGYGMMFYLFEASQCNWSHGGDYKKFEEATFHFLETMKKNHIKLKFFFDGSEEEAKVQTIFKRQNDCIEKVRENWQGIKSGKVTGLKFLMPYLAKETFLYVLHQFGAEIFICDQEADVEIAQYVIKHKYYAVLAQDSDFLLFDLTYIPFNTLKFTEEGIYCSQFSAQNTADIFRIPKAMLPLFGCLIGNDYTKPRRNILSSLHKRMAITPSYGHKFIKKVAIFLSRESRNSNNMNGERFFPKCLLKGRSEQEKNLILSLFEQAESQYNVVREHNLLESLSLPRECYKQLKEGYIDDNFIGILLNKQFFSRVLMEDLDTPFPSSMIITQSIRRKLYSVLAVNEVVEYIQCKNYLKKTTVEANENEFHSIHSLYSAENHGRETFLDIMECNVQSFAEISGNLLRFCCAVRFIIQRMKFFEWHLDALIVLYLHCSERISPKIEFNYAIPSTTSIRISAIYQVSLHHTEMVNGICGFLLNYFNPASFFHGQSWSFILDYFYRRQNMALSSIIKNLCASDSHLVYDEVKNVKEIILFGLNPSKIFFQRVLKKKTKESESMTTMQNNKFSILENEEEDFE